MLQTHIAALTLQRLTERDAEPLYRLMQANLKHLTAHGDYAAQIAAGVADIAAELALSEDRHHRFGIHVHDELIGRVDLIGVEPPRYGLGYWLASTHVGKGFATEAVRAAIDFAATECRATDIFAGVTHGNDRSVAVLARLNFLPVERFETYTRFHKTLP